MSVFAQEEPAKVYGSDELRRFMNWIPHSYQAKPPKLVAMFDQADRGIRVRHLENWSVVTAKKTATQFEADFRP